MSGTGVYPLHSLATQYPSAKLYQLGSTLEPYRLLEENEKLRRNLLETSTALRSSVAVVPAEVEALKHEIEHLREVAHSRLREIEGWKRRTADGKRGEEERAAQLKAEVERSVVCVMEREIEARMSAYRRDVATLREENLRLVSINEDLRRELHGLSEGHDEKLKLIKREWEQTLEVLIREELRRRESIFDSEKLFRDVEIKELKEHIAFLENRMDSKQQEIKKLDKDYAEAVVTRKEDLMGALAQRFKAEIEHHKTAKDKIVEELVSANRELKEEIFQLERKLALGEEAHRQELEMLRTTWHRNLESSRNEELARLRDLHRDQSNKYEAEILFLKQKLKTVEFKPVPLAAETRFSPDSEFSSSLKRGNKADPIATAQLADDDLAKTLAYFNIAPLRSVDPQETQEPRADPTAPQQAQPAWQTHHSGEDFSANAILARIKQSVS